MNKRMKILVIDDMPYNVASAHLTLKDFDYRVVDSIEKAYEILKTNEKFDVVLTDLWLPRGDFIGEIGSCEDPVTKPIPAGLVFAIRASNEGMKVVICTDSDHHNDLLCSLLDLTKIGTYDKERPIKFVEARTCPVEGVWQNGEIVFSDNWFEKAGPFPKDWLKAMRIARLVHDEDENVDDSASDVED